MALSKVKLPPKPPPKKGGNEQYLELKNIIANGWDYFEMTKDDLLALCRKKKFKVSARTSIQEMIKRLLQKDLAGKI